MKTDELSGDSGESFKSCTPARVEGGIGESAMPVRVRVKICGITSREDALAAVLAGADALGFNTWEGSKRYMDIRGAGGWMVDLPAFVTRVALCINKPLEEAMAIAQLPWVDALQFHGDESVEYCERFSKDTVDLHPDIRIAVVCQHTCLLDLGEHVGHERLTAKTWFDCHHEDHVDGRQRLANRINGCARLEGDACTGSGCADIASNLEWMMRGLDVEGDACGTHLGITRCPPIGVIDHEVAVSRY